MSATLAEAMQLMLALLVSVYVAEDQPAAAQCQPPWASAPAVSAGAIQVPDEESSAEGAVLV